MRALPTEADRRTRRGNETHRFIVTIATAAMLTWAASGGPQLVVPIAVLANAVVLAFGAPEEHFPMVVTWGLTSNVMVYDGRTVFVPLLAILLIRIALAAQSIRVAVGLVFAVLTVLGCNIAGELLNGAPIYRSTEIILMFLVFAAILGAFDWRQVDFQRATLAFIICTALVLLGSIAAGGGDLAAYVEAHDNLTRLGEDARVLGGSGGIPIFVLISTALLLTPVVRGDRRGLIWRIPVSGIFLVVGMLTISRVLIVGGAAVGITVLLLSIARGNVRIVGALAIVGSGLFWLFTSGPLNPVMSRFTARNEQAGLLSGRDEIYTDAVEYLSRDFSWLLFGKGAQGYVLNGVDAGSFLAYSAHNLVLDALLAWGVVGAGAFGAVIVMGAKRLLSTLVMRLDGPSLITAVAVAAAFAAGGSLWDFSTYVFLLAAVGLGLTAGRAQRAQEGS